MRWIRHDTDAHQDAKLQNVMLDYGLEGFGLYWYCVELIASKIDKDNLTFTLEHDARIIARNTGSTAQKVEEMMRYFVSIGLFEESNGAISCLKLSKRLNKSMTSNPAMRSIISAIKNHDPIMTESCDSHDPIMTESGIIMQDKIRLDQIRKECTSNELDQSGSESSKIIYQKYIDVFNETVTKAAKVNVLTDKRKRLLKKLIKTYSLDLDKWERYLSFINSHPEMGWLFEERPNPLGGTWKKKGFDFIVTENCYAKAKEI